MHGVCPRATTRRPRSLVTHREEIEGLFGRLLRGRLHQGRLLHVDDARWIPEHVVWLAPDLPHLHLMADRAVATVAGADPVPPATIDDQAATQLRRHRAQRRLKQAGVRCALLMLRVRGEITGPGKYETAGKSQSIFHSDQSHDLPPHPERGLLGCEQRTCTVDCCGPRRCPITNTPCPPLSRTAPPSISSVPVVEWLCSAQSHSDPMHWHTATQGTGTQAHSDPMHWHTATQCTGTQRPNALAHSDPMHWLTCAALDQQRATTGDAHPAAGEALHHGAPELAPTSRLEGRVPGTLNWRDKNRHDIGQSQSNWIACKMETPRSLPPLGHPPRRRAECSA
jgi:hypothetical protein